jgi:Lipase (class 3)
VISDHELVLLAAATYEKDAKPFYQPDGFLDRLFRWERPDGTIVYMVEGTYNFPGWIGDVLAWGTEDHPTDNHPGLGFLHADFYRAALRLFPIVAADARTKPVIIGGHSRGGGIAPILSGLLIDQGLNLVKTALFAPPLAGGQTLVEVVSSRPFCAYRVGNDPIPEVPFPKPPDFPYVQFKLTEIGEPCLIPIECHHCPNYVANVPGP